MSGKDVFISHASHDAGIAGLVCSTLETHNIGCWIAPRDIPPGEKFAESIMEAIKTCRIMVYILSSHSNSSEHTRREIERAVQYHMTIIPFRIEAVSPSGEIEYFISGSQVLDAANCPTQQCLPKLLDAVSHCLSKMRVEPGKIRMIPPSPFDNAPFTAPDRIPEARSPLRRWIFFSTSVAIVAITAAIGLALVRDRTGTPMATPPPASPSLRSVIRQPSETVTTVANQGLSLFRRGDLPGAVNRFTEAIRLNPTDSRLYAFRAQAYAQLRNQESAITDWSRSIELDPGDYQGYSSRGQVYLRGEEYSRALADFRKVVELRPELWLGHELMGDAYQKQGSAEGVLQHYPQAIQRNTPNRAVLFYHLAKAAGQLGDTRLAAEYLGQAMAVDPKIVSRMAGEE